MAPKTSKTSKTSKTTTANRRVRRTKKDAAPSPAVEENTRNVAPATPDTDSPSELSPALVEANELISDLLGVVDTLKTENARVREENRRVLSTVEAVQKRAVKFVRKATKGKRPKRKAGNNSGFKKPVLLTDDFCKFLDKPVGSYVSRTDAMASIRKYIKDHELQNPTDRRQIRPDNTLAHLLQINTASLDDEPLTYFNLNRVTKHLFVKEPKA